MSSILGMVCARAGSKRFPGKNLAEIDGISLVERAVRTLNRAGLNDIVVATDFELEFDPTRYGAVHLRRSPNVSDDIIALQDTVKWAYLSLERPYEHIIFLMPNCPMVTVDCTRKAIKLLLEKNYNVVRSYNESGFENGLVAVKTSYLLSHYIDVYCGACVCEGDEIHDEEDYSKVKQRLEAAQ